MEILIGISLVIGWIFFVVFSHLATTFIHELGHAIPSLLFTKNDVAIHIGSYGDEKNSFKIPLGRLALYFKFDIFRWNIGLCQHHSPKTYLENMLITLGGPIFSLGIGIVFLTLILNGTWNDEMIFIFSFFILSSVFDFFVNIIPFGTSIKMHDGSVSHNDGTILMQLIRASKYPDSYFEGLDFLEKEKYHAAAISFRKVLDADFNKKEIHYNLITSLMKSKSYHEALDHVLLLKEKKQLDLKDYDLVGEIFLKKGEYDNALNFFNKYLYKYYNDFEVLNQRGYTYLQLSEYEKAIQNFDSAILYEPDFATAYTNRGLAKIRLRLLDEGFQDLEKSKSLDDSNPYLYLYLGYYFQKKNHSEKAVEHFQKAKNMGIDFHGIDYLIETT